MRIVFCRVEEMSLVRKKDIVESLARARGAVTSDVEASGSGALPSLPQERLAFERWLSAYRHQPEELCNPRMGHRSNEQPNSNYVEPAPERC